MMQNLATFALLLAWSAHQGVSRDLPPIRNFLQVTPEFCTGGQPRMEHLAKLKADGVKAVLNLRQPTEHRAEEERAAAEHAGLKYFNIPVSAGDPKDEQVVEFLRITDDPSNRPMFIHCTAAIRVGAFWMIRRALRDGWPIEKAQEEAKKVGLTTAPHLEEFARSYVERHKGSDPIFSFFVKMGSDPFHIFPPARAISASTPPRSFCTTLTAVIMASATDIPTVRRSAHTFST
jgi:uncharacterized protein (TIGR01244 family)